MPNFPIVTARKFIKALKKKGFSLHRVKGSHHIFIRQKDQITISVPVHPGHDLGRGITLSLLKEAGITPEEFISIV